MPGDHSQGLKDLTRLSQLNAREAAFARVEYGARWPSVLRNCRRTGLSFAGQSPLTPD
jgi:hypothetical protein